MDPPLKRETLYIYRQLICYLYVAQDPFSPSALIHSHDVFIQYTSFRFKGRSTCFDLIGICKYICTRT